MLVSYLVEGYMNTDQCHPVGPCSLRRTLLFVSVTKEFIAYLLQRAETFPCACVRVTADQAGLQKVAEKFKKYDFSALLLIGGFEVTFPLVNISRNEYHRRAAIPSSASWFQFQLSSCSACS